jgi:hypothetical protein
MAGGGQEMGSDNAEHQPELEVESPKPHGPVSERFMRQHYGPSGITVQSAVSDEIRLACAEYCQQHDLDVTLGTMKHMADFAETILREFS